MKHLFFFLMTCCLFGSTIYAQSWNISGNAGTNPALHFLGTTDDQPLRFRIFGAFAGLISNENVFFGKFAGLNHTTGFSNVAIGNNALSNNTNRYCYTRQMRLQQSLIFIILIGFINKDSVYTIWLNWSCR